MNSTAVAEVSIAKTPAFTAREDMEVVPPVVHLGLVRGTVLIDAGDGYVSDFREAQVAALSLVFDYEGVRVGIDEVSDDGTGRLDVVRGGVPVRIVRDRVAEAAAQRLLERFGPVEVSCYEECVELSDSAVDYLIDLEGDPDALAEFSVHAVPQLRAAGWQVEIAGDYPCQVVETARWFASVEPGGDGGEDDTTWFELELGVEIDGERVDLLPILLEVLEGAGARSLESLSKTSRRVTALSLGGNRCLAVPPERLRMVLQIVRELYDVDGMSSRGRLCVPHASRGYFEDLECALGIDAVDACDAVRATFCAPVTPCEVPQRPLGLEATLRPYQQAGVQWLLSIREGGGGGILADDMGLGKTLQTIAWLVCEKTAGRLHQPTLIVAPTSLIQNWRREIQRFAPGLSLIVMHGPRRHARWHELEAKNIIITTYPLLVRDINAYAKIRFHSLVLDEAQMIKNARSQAHQAVRVIDAESRLCLSGTPIENNLEELRALFDVLMPGFLGDAGSFRTRFRLPIERLGQNDRLETLRRRVAPFVLRRLKDEVLTELPPKTESVRTIQLVGAQRELYESIRMAAHASVRGVVRKKGIAAATVDILGALMKLRQVCCDSRLVPVDAARGIEDSAKLDMLIDMILELKAQGRRMLVFSQFTSMMELISDALKTQGVDHLSLTGAIRDRQGLVDAFESGRGDVFLISLKAGGTGLNLTSADTVIHYDPWWNPAAQNQATDRAYRMGQRKPVFVYNLIVAGSVEEKMMALQRRKASLAEGLLAGCGESLPLSESDVEDLFGSLPES
ncbi:MAG: DEAD/DEAH box helicase [Nannocystaceae bacterium]